MNKRHNPDPAPAPDRQYWENEYEVWAFEQEEIDRINEILAGETDENQ
jgi:hypothetical protein